MAREIHEGNTKRNPPSLVGIAGEIPGGIARRNSHWKWLEEPAVGMLGGIPGGNVWRNPTGDSS